MQKAFAHVANAARTANRVVAVTKGESENTTDVEYKGKLDSTQTAVTTGEWVWWEGEVEILNYFKRLKLT